MPSQRWSPFEEPRLASYLVDVTASEASSQHVG
jgi:hypothetical protein